MNYHVCGEENVESVSKQKLTAVVQGIEYLLVPSGYGYRELPIYHPKNCCLFTVEVHPNYHPQNLCPFTVEVYPTTLYVGDPLYIRLNFQNNTHADAYAHAGLIYPRRDIEENMFAFYFKCGNEIIPWNVSDGFGHPGNSSYVWQKIKPGEKGLTQHFTLAFPGVKYGQNTPFYSNNLDRTRWEEIKKTARRWEGQEEVRGQLLVVMNNGYAPAQLQTLVVASPISIKSRDDEEWEALGLDVPFREKRDYNRNDLEHIISTIASGTLQNLLKYQLLLLELWELSRFEIDEETETQMLEFLGEIEKFLKPLHEIERENLRRILHLDGNHRWAEERIKDNKKILEKFTEVFGEKFTNPSAIRLLFDKFSCQL